MKRLAPVLVLAAAIVPSPTGAQPQDPVALVWKFTKGEAIRYDVATQVSWIADGEELKDELRFRVRLEPKEVSADGAAALSVVFERVRLLVNTVDIQLKRRPEDQREEQRIEFRQRPGEDRPTQLKQDREGIAFRRIQVDYDSQTGIDLDRLPAHSWARILAWLPKGRLTVRMTPQGTVSEAAGMNELVDTLAFDEGTREELKHTFGNAWIERFLRASLPGLPTGPVAPGAVWETIVDPPCAFSMLGEPLAARAAFGQLSVGRKAAAISEDLTPGHHWEVGEGTWETKREYSWLIEEGRLGACRTRIAITPPAPRTALALTFSTTLVRKRLYK